MSPHGKRLSICIATRNRAKLIGEALERIGGQLTGETEVVVAEGAVKRVLALLETNPEVLIVDVEVCSDDFSTILIERRLPFSGERRYGARDVEKLFVECA